ncbi:hypothetical protein RCL_jg22455.t1 [Rhizophagus clarus]|uniref:Uncharacterized protein n=1 Tax=Rhizophagus clarus TaxID=94130 RepID=A0A8H3MDS1_9GLOM|nr:hypothetical protein RCL_jg22455.t1 [Rhizophagus clarus]
MNTSENHYSQNVLISSHQSLELSRDIGGRITIGTKNIFISLKNKSLGSGEENFQNGNGSITEPMYLSCINKEISSTDIVHNALPNLFFLQS